MNKGIAILGILGWGLLALGSGCSSTAEEETPSDNALIVSTDWAIDMAKVAEHYCSGGQACTTKYFLGMGVEETGLPLPSQMDPNMAPLDKTIIWDQANFRPLQGEAKRPTVILPNGSRVSNDKGHINIIPLLKDTDPRQQKQLREVMQDGDVLVYFHPEDKDTNKQMERRASHVAMHYDMKADKRWAGKEGEAPVHHIDNPNNYGPQYNHPPTRHMPFHVFRFQPQKPIVARGGGELAVSPDQAKKYGAGARKWAMITNDLSPFADFFTLTLQKKEDLRTGFVEKAIVGQEIDKVYCSGLAYTNLNLAVNYPLNQNGLGAELWSKFLAKEYGFSDTNAKYKGSDPDLQADGSLAAADQLIFPPYLATDILNHWVDVYMAHLPLPARQGILSKPELAQQIAAGFGQLSWGDALPPEKRQNADFEPASPENIARWGKAYGLGADKLDAYLAADPPLKARATQLGIVAPGKTPMQIVQEVEAKWVKNRFVPPRIWMDEANKDKSNMVYVGTVINCELLSPVAGSADPCNGGGKGSNEFMEAAADTSTADYAIMGVPNGGERTHRRFDASNGPELIDVGSQVTVRATHPNASDVLFLLHLPSQWAGTPNEAQDLRTFTGTCNAAFAEGKTCSPNVGIPFKAPISGKLSNEPMTVSILSDGPGGVCTRVNGTTMKCPIMEKRDGKWVEAGTKNVPRAGHGKNEERTPNKWGITMLDRGTTAENVAVTATYCAECEKGGGHFNGWSLHLKGKVRATDGE